MTDCPTLDVPSAPSSDALFADDRFLVRDPLQVQQLLRALIDQRALVTAHPAGRDQSFPTAVLELDADDNMLVIDGSPVPSINHTASQASHLLCYAKLDQVSVRFELAQPERVINGGRTSFRTPVPQQVHHLQRRELYRLETPVNDSPWCVLPPPTEDGKPFELRVIDISAGGIALSLPNGQTQLRPLQVLSDCVLRLPDSPPIHMDLEVRDLRQYTAPNGLPLQRVGLKFVDLPRGADAPIQRYIFRVIRQRKARENGDL